MSIAFPMAKPQKFAALWSILRKLAFTQAILPVHCPRHSLPQDVITELARQSKEMALALEVSGLMNIQYAIKDNEIFILEVNPRASRTVPFVAKTIGVPIAKVASRIMAGEALEQAIAAYGTWREAQQLSHITVKEAVFPFARFPGVDVLLGPEMRSTGEVMGIDTDYAMAYAKALLGAGTQLPSEGAVFISVRDDDKAQILPAAKRFTDLGFKLVATGGTQRFFVENGLECERINKVLEGRPHIEDAIHNQQIQLVINTTQGSKAMSDSAPCGKRRYAPKRPIPPRFPLPLQFQRQWKCSASAQWKCNRFRPIFKRYDG